MKMLTVTSATALALSGWNLPAQCPGLCGSETERLIPGGAVETNTPGQGGRQWGPERLMEQLDANGDGTITLDEIPGNRRDRFGPADADGDGTLTEEELRNHLQAQFQGPGRPASGEARPRGPISYEDMLERVDGNGDGQLQLEEIPERRRDRYAEADADGNGILSPEEYQSVPPRGGREGGPGGPAGPGGPGGPLSPEATIERFDANGDGLLQMSELPERRRERLAAADTDGDDAISVDELRAHMDANRPQGGPGAPPPPPDAPPPPPGGGEPPLPF